MYTPDKWVCLKMTQKSGEVLYKIFANWYGGYLNGDSWQLNSGVANVEIDGDIIKFHGYSGSVYACHKNCYGTSGYGAGILGKLIGDIESVGVSVEIVPEQTDWLNILKGF